MLVTPLPPNKRYPLLPPPQTVLFLLSLRLLQIYTAYPENVSESFTTKENIVKKRVTRVPIQANRNYLLYLRFRTTLLFFFFFNRGKHFF